MYPKGGGDYRAEPSLKRERWVWQLIAYKHFACCSYGCDRDFVDTRCGPGNSNDASPVHQEPKVGSGFRDIGDIGVSLDARADRAIHLASLAVASRKRATKDVH